MAASPLLSLLASLSLVLLCHHPHVIHASAAAPGSLQCRSGWTSAGGTLQTLSPAQIDDGYCDCPLDGLDEPHTDACAGAMDGMWAGVPPKFHPTDFDAAKPPAHFACPQQPALRLPLGRVDDGICDCCDGADESAASSVTCPDVCAEVLAEERAARAKAERDYAVGSGQRLESIEAHQKWHFDSTRQLNRLRNVDLLKAEKEGAEVDTSLREAKLSLAREWRRAVNQDVLGKEALVDVVGSGAMTVDDLASFVVSMCARSAELSSDNVANERCVALDRASLDVGMLWDYSTAGEDAALPTFTYLDTESEEALVDFADKIMLRLEGKDTRKDHSGSSRRHRRHDRRPPSSDDSGDDPYGDDWEDHHDYHDHIYDDDYLAPEHDYHEEEHDDAPAEEESDANEEIQLSDSEAMVKSLLAKIPIDRNLFKEQSKVLLKYSPPKAPEDDDDEEEGGGEEEAEATKDDEPDADDEEKSNSGGVDPMALQMTKSAISKRLSSIHRGETSAKSAARFVAAVMEKSDSALGDMKNLAIMTMYHSKISMEDIAELVYSTSSGLHVPTEDSGSESCAASWSTMCPPGRVIMPDEEKAYPPSLIISSAQKLCDQRENAISACAVQEEDETEFPSTLPDGYYNYYEPQSRGTDDALTAHFASMDTLHTVPTYLTDLRERKEDMDKKRNSITKKVADLENEIGDESKYGAEGELYSMRDTCHKLESGKYEYEVCIFGKATQRDIGQTSGGTNLGTWEKVEMEDGVRTLKWGGGTKCWNGPVRSAEVTVTCGAETKLLTADEPETCRYVFTMESPIGCDEPFKLKNGL